MNATPAGQDLLHTANARVYVADLPPKYNLHTIAKEGCEEGQFLKDLLANPLGSMFDGSLDLALYRRAHMLTGAVAGRYVLPVLLPTLSSRAPSLTAFAAAVLGGSSDGRGRAQCRDPFYYSLEVHMHLQMLYSPLRVLSPEEADVVYALCPLPELVMQPCQQMATLPPCADLPWH